MELGVRCAECGVPGFCGVLVGSTTPGELVGGTSSDTPARGDDLPPGEDMARPALISLGDSPFLISQIGRRGFPAKTGLSVVVATSMY